MQKNTKLLSLFLCMAMLCTLIPKLALFADAGWDPDPTEYVGEFPIALYVEDMEAVENVDGMYQYDDNEWFDYYSYKYDADIVMTFADGHTETHDWLWSNFTNVAIRFEDGQSAESPWGLGAHPVTVSFCTVETLADEYGMETEIYTPVVSYDFTVTVVETPIEHVEASNIELMEYGVGSWNTDANGEEYFFYCPECEQISLYYKNGKIASYDETGNYTDFLTKQAIISVTNTIHNILIIGQLAIPMPLTRRL